ncbi:two-component signal transduction histidine kinase [Erythrobacter sp. NAP1]|uniref:histidine kinase dimerization/phospho-acceptor domain-containing protein n=1 Tax=Erythrobacter sp. NAP1 TaxID=237727 RepID=UPI0000686C47|nr:histidine kinase dimerization/phospho-acceptor domain-containing protein [Erythrobacter sp. NAP1]EAQ29598.1 two-component signal transduction histidine kinase [Erythrobacter sp. NAP1]
MFFDDRLATVLRQRAQSDGSKRTQYRQLLDILGAERMGAANVSRDPSLAAAAWLRMDALAEAIPSADRARMVREPGWRFRNPELAAHLADAEPDVASAALSRAQLSDDDWAALIPRLPVRARGFLRLRNDLPAKTEKLLEKLGVYDRGLPSPETGVLAEVERDLIVPSEPPQPEPLELEDEFIEEPEKAPQFEPEGEDELESDPQSEGRSEISALVERIAAFKRNRGGKPRGDDDQLMPRLPLGEQAGGSTRKIAAFGFAGDAAGRIEWADGEIAPMVIGSRLVAPARLGSAAVQTPLERAVARRQPISGASLSLDGAEGIAGEWVVDAQPRFTEGGNFAGYVGRFRRPASSGQPTQTAAQREADRIRQLLHELRTPVTAVQGYAEVIQQQLFGNAPHEYRALAAAIAADAARILAGFEELDRLARLETGVIEVESGVANLTALTQRTVGQLAQVLGPRMSGIELAAIDPDGTGEAVMAAVDPEQAEALLWRLLATLGGGCAAGEMLTASVERDGDFAKLTSEVPAQLLSEENIFAADARPLGSAINAGLFGAGFALRLARAEARSGGGDLVCEDEIIVLTLPIAQD